MRRLSPCTPAPENHDQWWPGVRGEPPLVVTADALSFRFLSAAKERDDDSSPSGAGEKETGVFPRPGSWGFRLTAKSRQVRGSFISSMIWSVANCRALEL